MKPLFKRVPKDMVPEYTVKGWIVHRNEGRCVVLVWDKKGVPP